MNKPNRVFYLLIHLLLHNVFKIAFSKLAYFGHFCFRRWAVTAVQAGAAWGVCSWKKFAGPAFRQRPVPRISRVDYRRSLPHPDGLLGRHYRQVRNLGYSRSGTVSQPRAHVLQVRVQYAYLPYLSLLLLR